MTEEKQEEGYERSKGRSNKGGLGKGRECVARPFLCGAWCMDEAIYTCMASMEIYGGANPAVVHRLCRSHEWKVASTFQHSISHPIPMFIFKSQVRCP